MSLHHVAVRDRRALRNSAGDRSSGTSVAQMQQLEGRTMLAAATAFASLIDNPYLPMIPGTTYTYRGVDDDGNSLRVRVVVTDQTKLITGVTTTVVQDRVYTSGKLSEDTKDFFAQDKAGNVWYFGEDTKELDPNGVVTSTEGTWQAGVNGATPGIVMLAQPAAGDSYRQELAVGVAEDQATVLGHQSVSVPFASFGNCLKTREFTALEPSVLEDKLYAPGIGLVRTRTVKGGTEVTRLVSVQLTGQAFGNTIDNPFMPMIPGTTYTYRGVDDDGNALRVRVVITEQTKVITGVSTTVVQDRVYTSGKLSEDTKDFFAQDKAGNVWYFGEDTKELDANGVVTSTEGTWQAGVNGATPGIVMLAQPAAGDSYRQELAVGVAEDQATVLGHQSVSVPFASFGNCLKTREFTALEPSVLEDKLYAPGIGLVRTRIVKGGTEVTRLVSVVFGS